MRLGLQIGFRPRARAIISNPNLFLSPEALDSADWAKLSVTVTANTTVAPDGATSAETITENTSSNYHNVYQAESVTAGLPYVHSAHFKEGSNSKCALYVLGNQFAGGIHGAVFDLSTGTVAAQDANLSDAGITLDSQGFYRCWIAQTAATTGSETFYVGHASSGNALTYTGSSRTLFVWGAKLEQAESLSSYTG